MSGYQYARIRTQPLRCLFLVKSLCLQFVFCLMATALFASPLHAQAPQPDDQMYAVAKKLNCPTCAGRNLADCPTDTCTQWKAEISDQLKRGKTPEEIVGYFEARFGTSVLQEPPKTGFTLFMWLIPLLALIGLAVVAVRVLQRSSKPTALGSTSTPVTTPVATIGVADGTDPYTNEIERQVKEGA